jgi:hypothetical protein
MKIVRTPRHILGRWEKLCSDGPASLPRGLRKAPPSALSGIFLHAGRGSLTAKGDHAFM